VPQSHVAISPTLTVVEAKFTHQHSSPLHSNFHSIFAVNWERSLLAKHLATQLLLRLNPKREAAAPIEYPPKLLRPRA
jgi:hypothetical protein